MDLTILAALARSKLLVTGKHPSPNSPLLLSPSTRTKFVTFNAGIKVLVAELAVAKVAVVCKRAVRRASGVVVTDHAVSRPSVQIQAHNKQPIPLALALPTDTTSHLFAISAMIIPPSRNQLRLSFAQAGQVEPASTSAVTCKSGAAAMSRAKVAWHEILAWFDVVLSSKKRRDLLAI